jgi:hypothetical protein
MCGDGQRLSFGQRAIKEQIFNVVYCSLRTESTCTQHCVQIHPERQGWQGNCTVSVIATPLKNGSVTPTAMSKETAAMYNFRRGICWGSSCLMLGLKIIRITMIQLSRFQTISRRHYGRILHSSAFIKRNIFPTLQTSTYNHFYSSNMSKNTQHLHYQTA